MHGNAGGERRLTGAFLILYCPELADCRPMRTGRASIAVSADLDGINITQGAELLTSYQFNTNTAKHYFCSRCGIYTHHQRRSNPNQYGVNVSCLDGVSPFDFQQVPVYDGTRHPRDGYPLMQAGTLIFRAADTTVTG